MKTLFYQVRWTKEIENIIKKICQTINCKCDISQVFGAPISEKEIWFEVEEKDIDFIKNQMNNI